MDEVIQELIDLRGYLTALMVCYPETEGKIRPALEIINRLLSANG